MSPGTGVCVWVGGGSDKEHYIIYSFTIFGARKKRDPSPS